MTPSDECPTCGNTGYMWVEDSEGKTWMFDCDNDDCNAFGQFDACDECGSFLDLDGYDGLCGNCADKAESEVGQCGTR